MASYVPAVGRLTRLVTPSNGLEHNYRVAEVHLEAGTPDVTSSRTEGLQALLVGIKRGTVTFRGPKCVGGNDNLTIGADIVVNVYITPLLHLDYSGVISDIKVGVDVTDAVAQDVTIRSTGSTFTLNMDGAA